MTSCFVSCVVTVCLGPCTLTLQSRYVLYHCMGKEFQLSLSDCISLQNIKPLLFKLHTYFLYNSVEHLLSGPPRGKGSDRLTRVEQCLARRKVNLFKCKHDLREMMDGCSIFFSPLLISYFVLLFVIAFSTKLRNKSKTVFEHIWS